MMERELFYSEEPCEYAMDNDAGMWDYYLCANDSCDMKEECDHMRKIIIGAYPDMADTAKECIHPCWPPTPESMKELCNKLIEEGLPPIQKP